MDDEERFRSVAALIGEPARATMLWSLLDGKALTATELAIRADVSAQSASMHLNKLVQAELLAVESQGRHRYYRFRKPETAYVIEALATLVTPHDTKTLPRSIDTHTGIRYCRTCYDHLAGKVAVEITNRLVHQKIVQLEDDHYNVTRKGLQWFDTLGIDTESLQHERRQFARRCLDWSERKPHLAGSLGAALLNTWIDSGWITRQKNTRATTLTAKGQQGFYKLLGLNL
ncbi:ArsR/SmtB family transcription factor [Parachryseolinea silvisoli]|jgi:DNA-binding transcriptional ArsR family regulator|uniref:ArsR/SmtB family transcription factor n=1 Tax=Parachryseolinea silvisoli TaxID=2873601 RepID=UPI002265E995|nr:helix-turn-helix transcriptional regulator [Parachryseolinea silvisoli]MCD9020169.1 ArsR family transcriptional regulator [Parachryseolinea silvisoli]